MNRLTQNVFGRIVTAMTDYQQATRKALEEYRIADREAKQESQQYKDENGVYSARHAVNCTNARNRIKQAKTIMTSVIQAEVKELKKELADSLTTRPSPAFLDALRVYSDFQIAPTKTEVEALLTLNGGCPLGLRAMSAVMEKTKCNYRLDYTGTADFEKDLASLERFSQSSFVYSPDGFHGEVTEIFRNQPRLLLADDGTLYDAGYRWDSTSILTSTAVINSTGESVNAMSERWSKTILPSIRALAEYEDKTSETGEITPAEKQFAEDFKETANAAEIQQEPVTPDSNKGSGRNFAEIMNSYK